MNIQARATFATIALWLPLFIPSAAMMLMGAGSMLPGLIISCLFICWAALLSRRRFLPFSKSRRLRSLIYFLLAIFAHSGIVAVLGGAMDWLRLSGSLFAFVIILFAATEVGGFLKNLPDKSLNRILVVSFWVLIVLGLISAVVPPVFPPITHPRPVVFFIEPSHYSLVLIPFAGYLFIKSGGWRRWALAFAIIAWGLLLESVTLLVGVAIILLSVLPIRQFILFSMIALIALLVTEFDINFLTSRIVLSAESDNLSNLVLVQGWERAGLSLMDTIGVGLGFQQFGVWGPQGEIQEAIYVLAGDYLNYYDGGSSASKLVAEFGFVGVMLLGAFCRFWYRSTLIIKVALNSPSMRAWDTFLCVIPSAIAVELFVRGVGYFSFGLVLACFLLLGPSRNLMGNVKI